MRQLWLRYSDYRKAVAIARELESREFSPPEKVQAIQQTRLERVVRHAVQNSTFYRELYRGIDLSGRIDLSTLPVVSKAMLMDNFDRAVTDPRLKLADIERRLAEGGGGYYLDRYLVHAATGSSGAKGVFVLDRRERQNHIAVDMRRKSWIPDYWRSGTRTAGWGPTADGNPKVAWTLRSGLRLGRTQILDYRDSPSSWVRALNSFQPRALRGFSSSVALVAAEQLDGHLRIQPKVVITSGEVCSDDMERLIADAWGITPYDDWGCSEAGPLAADCSYHDGLHLFEEGAIVEVVDQANRPVPEGVVGDKVLVTNFSGYALPRIRYENADFIARLDTRCGCGRTLPLIDVSQGRSEDALYLPGRRGGRVRIHPDACRNQIASVAGIKEHQVIYDGRKLTVLAVLRDGAQRDDLAATVRRKLLQSLARDDVVTPEVEVEIVESARIERDPLHPTKLRLVIDKSRLTASDNCA